MKLFVEVVGWSAAVMILVGYGLLSAGKVSGRSVSYHVLNICGSIGFVVNSGYNGALPSVALNVIWMAIGLFALAKIRSQREVG